MDGTNIRQLMGLTWVNVGTNRLNVGGKTEIKGSERSEALDFGRDSAPKF